MSSDEVIRMGPPPVAVLFVAMVISLAIVVPLTGVLVRFRANYNPKALHLDSEGGATPHTGPVVNSYIQMFARVQRIEVGCSNASYVHFTYDTFREFLAFIKD